MDYCTLDQVAAFLGQSLSVSQAAEATALIPVATTFINSETRQDWSDSAVTNEHHLLTGENSLLGATGDPSLWLRGEDVTLDRPFTSITDIHAIEENVSIPLQYTIIDASRGWLRIIGGWYGRDAYVSYVPDNALPSDISLAATMLVAFWLRSSLHPERVGLARLSIGGTRELEEFMEAPVDVPVAVMAILRNYRKMVFA